MLATLIIVFREVIEAGLIVGIVLAATKGVPGRGRNVAAGVGAGVLGACLVAVFAGQISDAFAGSGQELFNAAILILAVAMLAWHVAWMARHGRDMANELRMVGHDVAAGRRRMSALTVVVAVAVLREGAEVVLFLYGIAVSGGTSAAAMLAGGVLGLALGAGLTALTTFGLVRLPAGTLFRTTGWLVTLLAAGLASQAAALLQAAGLVAGLGRTMWNSSWLLTEDSLAGRMLHTLIGYTARPDEFQLLAYAITLVGIAVLARLAARPQPRNQRTPA